MEEEFNLSDKKVRIACPTCGELGMLKEGKDPKRCPSCDVIHDGGHDEGICNYTNR